MSKVLLVSGLSALAVLVLQSDGAFAFHPFDEPQGYQMPDFKNRKAAARAAGNKPSQPAQQRGSQPSNEDDADRPAKPERAAKATPVKNPPVLDGGGRPAISPAAPPVVSFASGAGAGTIIIDTSARALYYTLSATTAYRYPISVGREGFTWTGTEKISRVASWPDWRPPSEMKERVPTLPDLMTGGVRNPLGAKALYLGNSLYRIHGTNDVATIGQAASSGCFRMTNSNVTHLAGLAGVGTTVRVVNKLPTAYAGNNQGGRKRG
jgi:lipoprotein-anchoring transpeptidase ErfK/SrfK